MPKNMPVHSQLTTILKSHRGRTSAITSRELSTLTGCPDRKVRLTILELIEAGLPVLSATERPCAGYFLPESRLEWQEYDRQMRSRIVEDCIRKARVKKNVNLYFSEAVQERLL